MDFFDLLKMGDHVHVAGALAVAEEGGLHPFGARQLAQFGGGDAFAPVVVGMQGDDGAVAGGQRFDKILDLIGKVHLKSKIRQPVA